MKRFCLIVGLALLTIGASLPPAEVSQFFAPAAASAGGSWSPTNETVLAWWDATTIAQADDTDVNLWTSRNNINLVANVAPKLQTAVQNGLDVVEFVSSTKYMSCTNLANNAKPFTVAGVVHFFAVSSESVFGGTATGGASFDVNTGTFRLLKQGVALIGSNPMVVNTWYAVVATYDASGNYAFYTNGVAGLSGTSDQTFTGGQVRIGASAGGSESLQGMIGDLIYDDAVWDEATRNNFFNWANAKWAIY